MKELLFAPVCVEVYGVDSEQNLDQSVKVCLFSTVLLKDKSYINSVFISEVT